MKKYIGYIACFFLGVGATIGYQYIPTIGVEYNHTMIFRNECVTNIFAGIAGNGWALCRNEEDMKKAAGWCYRNEPGNEHCAIEYLKEYQFNVDRKWAAQ